MEETKDIVDTALAAGSFGTLAQALTAAGLVDTLKGEGPFTVFAPTDEAFAKVDPALLESLLKPENKDTLIAVLTYHVVPGKVTAADVTKLASAKTVQGEEIEIKVDGDTVTLNGVAKVTAADVMASNGVIHVIDTVILPPSVREALAAQEETKDIVDTALAAGSFGTLAQALTAAGLVDTLKGEGPFTVFAPTDEAFAKVDPALLESLLKPENKDTLIAVLTYHVVPGKVTAADVTKLASAKTVQGEEIEIKVDGDAVTLNGAAKVTAADVMASNGVIHVIDTVILPPSVREALAAQEETKDIVDTALAAGSFGTLAQALTAAGLVDTLKGEGPFTVFAPTDEAFAKVDPALLESLLKPENKDTLIAVLTYHVVPGKVTAADVTKLASAKTVQGEEIEIKVDGDTVTLNGVAKVTAADVMASNGVIHVIDTVILPPSIR